MSFSQNVKEEILKNIKKVKGCCATSFLTAVLRSIGSLCVDSRGYCFSVESDNGELLMFCSQLAQTALAIDSAIYRISSPDEKHSKFVCKFDVAIGEKLHLTFRDEEGLHLAENPRVNLSKSCCRRAFVQALFLSCGSATIPDSTDGALSESSHSNYHLELRFANPAFADFVRQQFAEIDFRKTQRKNSTVLYLKDSEKIADFFVFTDAVNAKFTVENIIIGRSFRNTANRQRNCIDSNIDKAVEAASKQLAAIAKLRRTGKMELLPQPLREMAAMREQNPEANLAELAALLGISKSGVNHRLTKLLEAAQDI